MDEVLLFLLKNTIPPIVLVAFFIGIVLYNPEKVEKWGSLANKFLSYINSRFSGVFTQAHKRYVKYDLQSRLNDFTKNVSKSAPYFEDTKISIEWVEEIDKPKFITNNKPILRLSRHDPHDLNFVKGAYWTVSTKLLPRVKRYISAYQKEALDLYVTTKVIKQEKEKVIEYFLDIYLDPGLERSQGKVRSFYEQLGKIDEYGIFYPILLQELHFLSHKVYGKPKNDDLIVEVNRLVHHLEKIAIRNVGDDKTDLNFSGELCKFAIVIVGKSYKMDQTKLYIDFIEKFLIPSKFETIYVLGRYEYREFIDEIGQNFLDLYDVYKKHDYIGDLRRKNGDKVRENQHLVVLRASNLEIYYRDG